MDKIEYGKTCRFPEVTVKTPFQIAADRFLKVFYCEEWIGLLQHHPETNWRFIPVIAPPTGGAEIEPEPRDSFHSLQSAKRFVEAYVEICAA